MVLAVSGDSQENSGILSRLKARRGVPVPTKLTPRDVLRADDAPPIEVGIVERWGRGKGIPDGEQAKISEFSGRWSRRGV